MAWVVAPLLHNQDEPAEAVKVTLPPAQKVVAPDAEIEATGNGLTVTPAGEEVAEQPFALVTVTV
jgi:hypothetical protein